MSFVLSNIYYCGATTLPGKLEFTPSGLTWYCTVDKSDRKIEIKTGDVRSLSWYDFGKYCQYWVQVGGGAGASSASASASASASSSSSAASSGAAAVLHRFDGLRSADYERANDHSRSAFEAPVAKRQLGVTGQTWGTFATPPGGGDLEFRDMSGALVAPLPLASVAAAAVPARNELEIQLAEDDTGEREDECLVEVRLYVPQDRGASSSSSSSSSSSGAAGGRKAKRAKREGGEEGEEEGEEEEEEEEDEEEGGGADPADALRKRIVEGSGVRSGAGTPLCELSEAIGSFQVPRGRFAVEFYPSFFRMLGATYEFKVAYKSIARITYLPIPTTVGDYEAATRYALVVSLVDPLRQGLQRYPHLVLQLEKRAVTVPLAIPDKDRAEGLYSGLGENGEAALSGDLPKVVGQLFKKFTGKPVYKPENFESGGEPGSKQRGVRCNHKAASGVLYPLDKTMIFIHKPTVLLQYSDVERMSIAAAASSSGLFTLTVQCRAAKGEPSKSYEFGQIDKKEREGLARFLDSKGVKVVQDKVAAGAGAGMARQEELDAAIDGDDDDDEEDDEDFESGGGEEDEDEDEDEDEESDASEGGAAGGKKREVDEEERGFVRKGKKSKKPKKGGKKSEGGKKRRRGGGDD